MPQILLNDISKIFKISQRAEGKFGLIRGSILRKTKEIWALDHISFEIDEGELVGYIGPNGAGKSTTVKVMSGILTPEAGECVIMGRTP
jgi:ABC-2 type transport system ATP-binding protein